jgi:hypothetical protein
MIGDYDENLAYSYSSGSGIRRICLRSQSSSVLKLPLLPRGGMHGNFSS